MESMRDGGCGKNRGKSRGNNRVRGLGAAL